MTLKVEELAALVAGARLAAAALATQSTEQADELGRVLVGFDRAVSHIGSVVDETKQRKPRRTPGLTAIDGRDAARAGALTTAPVPSAEGLAVERL